MKIVDLKTFLSMPVGTVFCKYEPCFMEPLHIKGENCGERDFFYQSIADAVDANDSGEFFELLDNSEKTGAEVRLDFNCQGRDGCFKDDQLFAVWHPNDVRALIQRLHMAIEGLE